MLAAKFNGGDDVRHIGAVGDQKRPTVDHAIVDFARGVITRVALFDELSAQAGFEGSNGSFVQHVFLVTKNRAFGLTAHRIAAGPAFGLRALHRTAALTRQRAGTPAPHTAYRQCNNSARRCPLCAKSGHSYRHLSHPVFIANLAGSGAVQWQTLRMTHPVQLRRSPLVSPRNKRAGPPRPTTEENFASSSRTAATTSP